MAGKQPTKIDINTAPKEALVAVSGIGESLAQRIIDERPFAAVSELVRVSGISENKLAALRPYLSASRSQTNAPQSQGKTSPASDKKPFAGLGHTEAFVFLEDSNDRKDAFLIIFGGFIFGLFLLLLRRRSK